MMQLRRWFITLSAMFTDLHVYMKVTVNGKAPKLFVNGGAISVANAFFGSTVACT